ncbi:MAG TPA: alkaline phosphatase family protein [Acidimicrobiales bacterium]|nr:alkaline phosphatase family protein [Acidimicrobiales bacterium]
MPIGQGVANATPGTRSPIQHLVVIFQENVSFDHYFGTYPNATNTSGQPFYAASKTPASNGLNASLLGANPNLANPQRLDPANINDLLTCDQNHDYTAEQQAFDNGKMDQFVQATGTGGGTNATGQPCQASQVMDYYDGNTVTAMWNYAQHFAMSDNSFGSTFGPSSPGAINLASGNTGGVTKAIRGAATDGDIVGDGLGGYSLISDAQPYYDDCSSRDSAALGGKNIGDELNSAGLSWGWFQGGFRPTTAYSGSPSSVVSYDPTNVTGRAVCGSFHDVGAALGGTGTSGTNPWGTKNDYIPHHEPFQYYASTANPHHLAPASLSAIGTDTASPGQFDTANHQYDQSDFDSLVSAIHAGTMPASSLPAVSFLKASGYQDGHPGYSDPIDEQNFVVNEINSLEALPTWSSTAVVVAYDDSDGWYDHVYSGVTNPSQTAADVLTGAGMCGGGNNQLGGQQGRCGFGPRLPLLVISPWAKANYVSHTLTSQSSIIKFIQWNWHLKKIPGSFANVSGSLNDMFNFKVGTAPNSALYLNTSTGQPALP